jgi:tetratricopeptide (TPR) repeat protein
LARGRVASNRALELDPTLVQAHAVLGYEALMSGRTAESGEHFRQALTLNPNYASAHHWHAHLLALQGRLDLALAENERAVQLDPLSFSTLWIYARQLTAARQPAKALEIVRRSLRLRPDFAAARCIEALDLIALGQRGDAAAILRELEQEPLAPSLVGGQLVWGLREVNLPVEAAKMADTIVAAGKGVFPTLIAAGRVDEALGAGFDGLNPFHAPVLYWDPLLDPVREDPRFHQLVAKAGLTESYALAQTTLARMRASQQR